MKRSTRADCILKTQLLALDDFGLALLADLESRNLLEVIEDRNGSRSSLLTSQLPIEKLNLHLISR